MKEINYNGNLLDSSADIIAHQTNCSGSMNSGVAKAIKEKYPRVYEQYMKAYEKGLQPFWSDNSCGYIKNLSLLAYDSNLSDLFTTPTD